MPHTEIAEGDRCRADTVKGERCQKLRLEGYDTCRRHTDKNWPGRCPAQVRREKRQCRRNITQGYNVCQSHGAGSPLKGRPGGIHKITLSKPRLYGALPPQLGRRMEAAMNDPELLNLRSNVALSTALLFEELDDLRNNGSLKQWSDLQKVATKLRLALVDDSTTRIRRHAHQLVVMIKQGIDQRVARKEINIQQEYIRKLKDSEWKHLKDMEQMVTVEESNALIGKIATAFNNTTRLFSERLGPKHINEMQKMFGREMRNLQNIKDTTPRKKKRSTATYIDVESVPVPKTVKQTRQDKQKELEKGQ